ncbi:MAG: hypothetical protein ACT4PJ_11645, partial [Gemmatimonadaceae bacterium]
MGADSITIRRNREVDLTGDRRAERFVVLATGPRYDSLEVTLEIRSPEDSLLYTASWESSFYFHYDDRSQLTDSVVEQRVRAQVDSLLHTSAFRPGGSEPTTDERLNREGMRDAIRFDIAEDRWRTANRIPADSSTPPQAWDAINLIARDSVSEAQIESLVAGPRGPPPVRVLARGAAADAKARCDQGGR